MDEMQAGELLARIQVHDNRKVDDLVLEEWFQDLEHIDYDDAIAAVRAHRRLPDPPYLTISHVLAGVDKIRKRRLTHVDAIQPPSDLPDGPRGYIEWLKATREAVASGEMEAPKPESAGQIPARVRAALGGVGRTVPPES